MDVRELLQQICKVARFIVRRRTVTWRLRLLRKTREMTASTQMSDYLGGLNGWTQQLLEVYSRESENLRFFSGVDSSAVQLCPVPTGYSRTGLFSSGSIVVIAHSCFRLRDRKSTRLNSSHT